MARAPKIENHRRVNHQRMLYDTFLATFLRLVSCLGNTQVAVAFNNDSLRWKHVVEFYVENIFPVAAAA